MARNGFAILDSDMHVFEPHDLYLKYMDPKWGDRIPRGEPRKKHGQMQFYVRRWHAAAEIRVCRLSLTALRKPIEGEEACPAKRR